MQFILGLLAGLFLGAITAVVLFSKTEKQSGTFVIDFSDPAKDVCRLELETDINELYSKKHMVLAIKTYGENSLN